jgi:predicted secreted Zn-dependent protease
MKVREVIAYKNYFRDFLQKKTQKQTLFDIVEKGLGGRVRISIEIFPQEVEN